MIHKLYSDLPSFKTAKFHPGLNLVLAEKSSHSSHGKTRNGAGKSSLVELINSLQGSQLRKGSVLKSDELRPYTFSVDMDFMDTTVRVDRSGEAPNKLRVIDPSGTLSSFSQSSLGEEFFLSSEDWCDLLGHADFGLTLDGRKEKPNPTYRLLAAYFARSMKGFDSPEKTFPQQAVGNVQIAMTYLLKLDWEIVRGFEHVRQKDKLIKALNDASKEGTLGQIMGSGADLKTEIHLKANEEDRLNQAISEFRVLPQYQDKEAEASRLSTQLSALSAEDTTDKEWLDQLANALAQEKEPNHERIENLFSEASVQLPELVQRRFDELKVFHDSIIRNRKEHLKQEMEDVQSRIQKRHELKDEIDSKRSEILKLLRSHGALDQFIKLQSKRSELQAEIQLLRKKLEITEDLDTKKTELKIERQTLLGKMRLDHAERDEILQEAIITFADISGRLYDEPGRLIITPTSNGPKFEFDIPGKKSTGKSKMQIFCFDMMLMKLWAQDNQRPRVLIHDSLMFDGVDERQIAKALVLGAEMAERHNFQYIITLNSDDLPDMSPYPDFDLEKYRVDLEITDTPSGGLFGIRF